MVMYIVTLVILLLIFINYFLGLKLYNEPRNEGYYNNIKNYNVINQKNIMTSPKYVFMISSVLRHFYWNLYSLR